MAIVGQQLLAPETDWRRYDNEDSSIIYSSGWSSVTNNALRYSNTIKFTSTTTATIKFNFTGDKIRLIASMANDRTSKGVITIDGISYSFSEYNASANELFQYIVFEITGLTYKEHYVVINKDSSDTTSPLNLDAIDIASSGILKLYNNSYSIIFPEKIKTSIEDINSIGDMISQKYSALTSGQVGAFSEFGTTVAPLIPVTSSAMPNGSFYWIYFGNDNLDRKIFIADRNIQHSISYDALNVGGIINEKVFDFGLGNKYKTSIRLLSGGTTSTDIDNEWSNIIVGSTLNGIITAGDNAVWNWSGISSWTSSTGNVSPNRIIRGSTNVGATNAPTGTATTSVSTTIGFRPLLLLETLPIHKYLIKQNSNYYTINASNYDSATIHSFSPLVLVGGANPNKADIDTFGFNDIGLLTNSMTVNTDTFIPVLKFDNTAELKLYKG